MGGVNKWLKKKSNKKVSNNGTKEIQSSKNGDP